MTTRLATARRAGHHLLPALRAVAKRGVLSATAMAVVAAGIVFSPLVAALAGASWAGVADAARHVGRPLAASAGLATVAAAMAVAVGFPFALLVDRAGTLVRRTAWGLAAASLIVPPYVVAESAVVLLGPTGKVSRGLALLAGFGPPAGDVVGRARYAVPGWVYTVPAAGVVVGGCLFPIVAVAVAAANRRTDRRVFESARLMRGRSGVARVAAHLLVPPAVGAALLAFALALTESVVPQLLRVPTVGEAIYERIQEGELATAAAVSLPLLPVIVLAGAAGAFILVRARSASLASLEGEVPNFLQSRAVPARGGRRLARDGAGGATLSAARDAGSAGPGPGRPGSDVVAAAVTLVAVAPALLLPAVSLTWLATAARLPPSVAGGHRVLRASGFLDALQGAWELARDDALRTAVLAMATATLAVALATGLAWPLARTRWAWLLGGLGAGLAVPASVVGLGLIALWNHAATAAVYGSLAVVVLAWLARFLPVTVLLVQAAVARVPPELVDAAALAGRGPAGRFASVVLPNAAPGLAAAWVATYVLCATEFVATLLVDPPGSPLLAPSVVNLIRRGQDPEIAAVQVLLLTVVGVPVVGVATVMWVRHRSGRLSGN